MIRYRTEDASTGQIVRRQIAVGIGGDAQCSSTTRVQASTDHQHIAVTIAVYLTCVEFGGAIGSAISGAVWENDIPSKFREYLPPGSKQQAQSIYNSINNAFNFPVGSAERIGINRAYRESIHILLSSQFVFVLQSYSSHFRCATINLTGWIPKSRVESLAVELRMTLTYKLRESLPAVPEEVLGGGFNPPL